MPVRDRAVSEGLRSKLPDPSCIGYGKRGLGVVPTAFETLLEATLEDEALLQVVRELVASKREGVELGEGPRIGPISDFIAAELERQKARTPSRPPATAGTEEADALFREALDTIWR